MCVCMWEILCTSEKFPDRSSYVSIAMSLVGIVEDKLTNSLARRIRLFTLSSPISIFSPSQGVLVRKCRCFGYL